MSHKALDELIEWFHLRSVRLIEDAVQAAESYRARMNDQPKTTEGLPIELAHMNTEQVMVTLGVSRCQALALLAIERGDWAGDVQIVDEGGPGHPNDQGGTERPRPGAR